MHQKTLITGIEQSNKSERKQQHQESHDVSYIHVNLCCTKEINVENKC